MDQILPSRVFSDVARDAQRSRHRMAYSGDLHVRVDALVQEWLDGEHDGRRVIAYGKTEDHFRDDCLDCAEFVREEYKARYGRNAFGVPVIGWLCWPLVSALIGWIVQRTLDRMFPEQGKE
jgi:hypothetical protein